VISPRSETFQNLRNIKIEPKMACVSWLVFIIARPFIKPTCVA